MSDWAPALAIASVAMALTIYYTAKAWFAHRERMARIEKGLDKDQPPPREASK
jgi:hypothetical protein